MLDKVTKMSKYNTGNQLFYGQPLQRDAYTRILHGEHSNTPTPLISKKNSENGFLFQVPAGGSNPAGFYSNSCFNPKPKIIIRNRKPPPPGPHPLLSLFQFFSFWGGERGQGISKAIFYVIYLPF